jgi:hypothetical protein
LRIDVTFSAADNTTVLNGPLLTTPDSISFSLAKHGIECSYPILAPIQPLPIRKATTPGDSLVIHAGQEYTVTCDIGLSKRVLYVDDDYEIHPPPFGFIAPASADEAFVGRYGFQGAEESQSTFSGTITHLVLARFVPGHNLVGPRKRSDAEPGGSDSREDKIAAEWAIGKLRKEQASFTTCGRYPFVRAHIDQTYKNFQRELLIVTRGLRCGNVSEEYRQSVIRLATALLIGLTPERLELVARHINESIDDATAQAPSMWARLQEDYAAHAFLVRTFQDAARRTLNHDRGAGDDQYR